MRIHVRVRKFIYAWIGARVRAHKIIYIQIHAHFLRARARRHTEGHTEGHAEGHTEGHTEGVAVQNREGPNATCQGLSDDPIFFPEAATSKP